MSANLLRRAALLGSSQQKLSFQPPRRVETRDVCTQWEPTYDNFDQFSFEIQIQEVIKEAVQIEEEVKQPALEHQQIPAKVDYQCKECNKVFPYKSTYKRHLRDIHNDMPRLYLKHQKKDGKYVCEFCEKPYSHTRDLKVHLKKKHNQSFVFIHEPTGNRFLQKRRSRNPVESLRVEVQKQVKMKKAVKNFPVSEINKIMVKIEAMKIPILKIIDLDSCLESYLTLEDKVEKRVITDDQYAYKIYPFNYFLADDKFQMEFANEYYALQKAKLNECRHIIQLDAILLGKDHVAFRLPLLEMTYREFLSDNRCQRQISQIVQQIVEGIEELHKLGYVHRDLKPENIMLNFQPLRVYIIDFNRAQRVQASAQGNVYGTPGYFPEREDWRDGDTQWDIWALAVIIIESDMPRNDYFSCRGERDSKQRIKQYLDKNKINGGLRELAYSTIIKPIQDNQQTIETIKNHLRKIKFRELPHDTKLMFVHHHHHH